MAAASQATQGQVETAIKSYIDPYMDSDLVSARAVKNIQIDDAKVTVNVQLGFPARGYADALAADLKSKVEAVDGVENATPAFGWNHRSTR